MCVFALGVAVIVAAFLRPRALAQSEAADWEKVAGGRMAFDVASVRLDTNPDADMDSNVPMRSMDSFSDSFTPTGGLFRATDFLLFQYIQFAYKLSPEEAKRVQVQLPKWADENQYDIVARASGNPTKDQFRMMMQSLLADRFRLAVHYETKELPVMALMLDKPGKLGPQLREHDDHGVPCTTASASEGTPTTAAGFPVQCGAIVRLPGAASGVTKVGARALDSPRLADVLGVWYQVDKPVVDDTGLGLVDFTIEYTPDRMTLRGMEYNADAPTFLEALKKQLGLKFEPRTAPVRLMIVDRIEEPSPN
ncbi:MAG TPA: TIGR03435 family protein [Candidatus Aquilonibacter sp.]|nr:TIGR03435 family protein [Candidatus Aquilonibacter sp.]